MMFGLFVSTKNNFRMKKIIYFLSAFFVACTASMAQSTFSNVEPNGFDHQNGSVTSIKTFHGKVYAALGHYSASIYRSALGDPGTFAPVYGGQFGFESAGKLTVSND